MTMGDGGGGVGTGMEIVGTVGIATRVRLSLSLMLDGVYGMDYSPSPGLSHTGDNILVTRRTKF
jgi:hypothetical protein